MSYTLINPMGLLYLFPVSADESDYVKVDDNKVTVKSYGLPLIFWGYAIAILIAISFMGFGVYGPIHKLIGYGGTINLLLGYSLIAVILIVPIALISFFFFEKSIQKKNSDLAVVFKLFNIPFYKKKYSLESNDALEIRHYLDSPNMARMQQLKDTRGFQNKGYFVLFAKISNDKVIQLDRCSKKIDLERLKELLLKF